MMKRNIIGGLLVAMLAAPQWATAQEKKVSIDPGSPQVSYVGRQPLTVTPKGDGIADLVRTRSRTRKTMPTIKSLMEQRVSFNNLLEGHEPIHITTNQLRRAKAKAVAKADRIFQPNNNHTHLIVDVIYNSMDETKEEGLYAIDVVTGELYCLVPDFEGMENDGFNGGGYIWNGKYRGVFYTQGTVVNNSNRATILEYNMDDWSLSDVLSIRYQSSMAVEIGTLSNADGSTTVIGEYWGIDGSGNLSMRYATLDDDGITTTSFGNGASKHMLAMGVTNDGRLYGVAKDGNLYRIDRSTGEEIVIGHTGITDLYDYEGHVWLQAGEIDQRDDTFYWMAEHSSVYKTELCSVNLATGRATVLIDFPGDLECAGMVVAPQQKKDETPAAPMDLTATFGKLQLTGNGTFTAPTKRYDGQDLAADAQLCYHLYVNDVKQTTAANQTTPGATVNFSIASTNVKNNAENSIGVTVSVGEDGEESLIASTTAWVGYGISQAPKNVAMAYDEDTHTATITWEAPAKGDNAGVKGGCVEMVNYFVWRVVDGVRQENIHNGYPLPDGTTQITYTLTDDELNGSLADLSFAVESWTTPIGFPLESLASETVTTGFVTVGIGKELPFSVDFANDYYNVNQNEYTVIDGNNDGRTWIFCEPHVSVGQQLSGAVAFPNYSTTVYGDDWFITPGLVLQAGKTYHFQSYMHGPSANTPYSEHIEVMAGHAKSVQSMTIPVLKTTQVIDYCTLECDFTVPEDGNYFFGLHAVSAPGQWEIALFDITISESTAIMADEQAPQAGTINITPIYGVTEGKDADGAFTYFGAADIKVTLPTKKQSGKAIADDEQLDVTLMASKDGETTVLKEFTAQRKGAGLNFKADNLVSGEYVFTVHTSLAGHKGKPFTSSAYVGWDNAVVTTPHMEVIQTNSQFIIKTPEPDDLKGAHGAYLPYITYLAYNGDKAATVSRALAGGYTDIFTQISADAESDDGELILSDINPQEGEQYNRGYMIMAISVDADGNLIYSPMTTVRAVVGQPLQAPAMEFGNQTYLLDATLSPELDEIWTYYVNRGVRVAGIQPIDDQFGHDAGKTWNVYSAFNGDLSAIFAKVDIASLETPVFSLDFILEDPEVSMKVEFNGLEGRKASHELTVMDGIQHVSIPLDAYKNWGWVQPTLVTTYHMAQEGEQHDIFFDNAGIFDASPVNLAIIDFDIPTEMTSGQESMANVTVMNMGSLPVAGYTVSIAEDDVNLQSQTFSKALKAGDTQVVQFPYRANTVSPYDNIGQEDAEKVLVATVAADGDAVAEDNMAEAVVTITVNGGKKNSYPTDAVALQSDGKRTVDVSWSFNMDEPAQVINESFEDYNLWDNGGVRAGGPQGQIGPWKLYDGDNKPTYTWESFEYVSQYAGEPQAFQVFSGDVFNSGYYSYDMTAATGTQYLVSMDPADGNYTPRPDDWLISPRVVGGTMVEFFYGGLVNNTQSVELYYSEIGQDVNDFHLLKRLEAVNTTDWYFAYATLPATARYFAIHHDRGSYMGYGLKIDDIQYTQLATVDHFNIYVDGRLMGTSETTNFTITEALESGSHKIAVTAIFANGTESVPAYATFVYTNGISYVERSATAIEHYSLDGKRLDTPRRGVSIVRRPDGTAGKVLVK